MVEQEDDHSDEEALTQSREEQTSTIQDTDSKGTFTYYVRGYQPKCYMEVCVSPPPPKKKKYYSFEIMLMEFSNNEIWRFFS